MRLQTQAHSAYQGSGMIPSNELRLNLAGTQRVYPPCFTHVCSMPVQRRTQVLKAKPPQGSAMTSVMAQKSREAVDNSDHGRQCNRHGAHGSFAALTSRALT